MSTDMWRIKGTLCFSTAAKAGQLTSRFHTASKIMACRAMAENRQHISYLFGPNNINYYDTNFSQTTYEQTLGLKCTLKWKLRVNKNLRHLYYFFHLHSTSVPEIHSLSIKSYGYKKPASGFYKKNLFQLYKLC